MDPVRFRRAQEIFARAIRHEPDERDTYLDETCGSDAEMRTLVDSLLAHHDDPAGLLGQEESVLPWGELFDAASGSTVEEEDLPAEIGGYRIRGILGRGGMGLVYEAEQERPRREVALKVIHPGVASAQLLARFRFESDVLGRLEHPGIARIYEAGMQEDGSGARPFFAMERIHGRPLLRYIAETEPSVRGRLELVARVCDAVHHAHQKGVIHRDLKPSNILVDEVADPPQPKVLDFGVARATDSDLQTVTVRTDIGQIVGTLPYMSPEQARGDVDAVDIRSDVYSLGVILFEVLTGGRPHELAGKPLHEAVRTIVESETRTLSSVDTRYRGDLDTIVTKALEREPDRRYESAHILAADLRRFLRDEPISARPPSTWYQVRKFVRRNRNLVGGLALTFAAMLVGTAVSIWQATEAHRQSQLADEKTRDALAQAVRARLAAAVVALEADDPQSFRTQMDAVPPEDRDWEWEYLNLRVDRSIGVHRPETGLVTAAFGTDGGAVHLVTRDGTILRWDPLRDRLGGELHLEGGTPAVATIDTARGRVIGTCSADGGTLAVWDLASGEKLRESDALPEPARSLALAPSGGWIVVAGDRRIWTWDLVTGALDDTDPNPELGVASGPRAIEFLPDGRHFVVGLEGGVEVYDRVGRHPMGFALGGSEVRCIAIGGDATRLAVGTASDGFLVDRMEQDARWPVSHRRRYRYFRTRAHRGPVTATAFRPDGARVASAGGHTVRLWSTESWESEGVLPGHDEAFDGLSFAPDGARLLGFARGGAVRVWEPERGPPGPLVLDATPLDLVVTADEYVSVVDAGGDLQVWDLRSGDRVLRAHTTIAGGTAVATALARSEGDGDDRFVTGQSDGSLVVRDATTGRVVTAEARHADAVRSVRRLGPDRGVSTSEDAVHLWRWSDLAPLAGRSAEGDSSNWGSVAAAADALAVSSGNDIHLLDRDTLATLRVLRGHRDRVTDLAISPDGARLASSSRDGTVRVWELPGGAPVRMLDAREGPVLSVTFSPSGTRLVTGHHDDAVRFWDVGETDAELLVLRGHSEPVTGLAFSADGRHLVSASEDGTLRVRSIAPDRTRHRAALLRRELVEDLRPVVTEVSAGAPDPGTAGARLGDRLADDPERLRVARELLLSRAFAGPEVEFFHDFEDFVAGAGRDRIAGDGAQPARLVNDAVRVLTSSGSAIEIRAPIGGRKPRTSSIELPGTASLGEEWTIAVRFDLDRTMRQRLFSSYDGEGPVGDDRLAIDFSPVNEKIRGIRVLLGQEWAHLVELPEGWLAPGPHHLAVTFDRGHVAVHLDGRSLALDNPRFRDHSVDGDVDLRFGEDADPAGVGGVDEQVRGTFDDIAVIGRKLDADEIARLARGEISATEVGDGVRALLYDFEDPDDPLADRFTTDGAQDGVQHSTVEYTEGRARMVSPVEERVPANAIEVGPVGNLGRAFTIAARVTPATDREFVLFTTGEEDLNFVVEPGRSMVLELPRDITFAHEGEHVAPGVPCHLAATYRDGEIRIYVDGREVASTRRAISDDLDLGGNPFRIGANHDPTFSDDNFEGIIDDVLLLRRAMTPAEIEVLARGGLPREVAEKE